VGVPGGFAVWRSRLIGNTFWVVLVDDDFIKGLFEIIEDLSYDASDPYHYPVIRVLVRIC
jgi:hypothetical protein